MTGASEHVGRDRRSPWWAEHAARYRFAADDAVGRVLDVACGSGIGFEHLERSTLLVGADLSAEALHEAKAGPNPEHTALCRLDATRLPFRSSAFDTITCFETIEHVDDAWALVRELSRVLDRRGVAFVSTPNVRVTGDEQGNPRNPFHVREFEARAFADLLLEHFDDVEVLGQQDRSRPRVNPIFALRSGLTGAVWTVVSKLAVRAHRVRRSGTAAGWPFPSLHDWTLAEIDDRAHVLFARCRAPRLSRSAPR